MDSSKFEQVSNSEITTPLLDNVWSEEQINTAISKMINSNFAVKMFLKSLNVGGFDAFKFIPKLLIICAKDKEGIEILKQTGIAELIELNKNG